MPRFGLQPLDWALVVLYALFIIGKGLWWSRRHGGAEDFFLAGRNMTWPLIGASLYASNLSSTTLAGLAWACSPSTRRPGTAPCISTTRGRCCSWSAWPSTWG